ncbi:hypothetical protein [Desulfosarcina sp. BuS5]|uniref:hypothetical protein n=2 Tax=Desulfosarcina sp. BuS5 TaxID=933262 RepID=UPI000487542F|nr:hypothetical protein [Desulfosarcina sp. BuS5]
MPEVDDLLKIGKQGDLMPKLGTEYNKEALFNKLKSKGILWCYSKMLSYQELGDELLIEHVLKYGDFNDLKSLFDIFNKKRVEKVWIDTLISDKRFIKLNYFLARFYFDKKVEADYFKNMKNRRYEKLKLLAS